MHNITVLTKSTVFLLFVSVSVSSTKLSHLPLQSSGSSVIKGHHKDYHNSMRRDQSQSLSPTGYLEVFEQTHTTAHELNNACIM